MGESVSTHWEMRNTKFWSEDMNGRNHSEDLDVNGTVVVDWVLEK
jgi:hypothetical protein